MKACGGSALSGVEARAPSSPMGAATTKARSGCHPFSISLSRKDESVVIARSVHPSRAAEALKDAGDCRPAIVGGVAIEKLESWLAAIAGTSGSEDLRRPEEILAAYGIDEKDTRAMVRLVENSGLGKLPADAQSLRRWLERARAALGVTGSDEPSS